MTDYRTHLEFEEGLRLKPYKCSEGFTTIGIGHNLDANGISQAVADLMYKEDEREAIGHAKRLVDDFNGLSDNRKIVLVSMVFQMGYNGVTRFKNTIQAINDKQYEIAAKEMLDSKWARQTSARAKRLSKMMENG
jgi:lysozyme